MAITLGGVEFDVDSTIKFRTKNAYDNNWYEGIVQSICKYSVAKNFGDIEAYHFNVLKTDSDISDMEDMQWVLITTEDEPTVPIGIEWIDPDSISLVDYSNTYTLTLYNISSEKLTEVRTYLTQEGIINKVNS